MKILSLFDGISCGRLALKRADIKVDEYNASEVDKNAIFVSQKNWNDIKYIGDVRELKGDNFKDIDMLIGGSPCQNFSFIGKMNGASTKDNIEVTTLEQYLDLKHKHFEFDGYSYLVWEYIRLLKEIKPKYFLLENVLMPKKWEQIITNNLGVEPIMINSNLVSAQDRKRLYWTNIPNVVQPQNKNISFQDIKMELPFRELKPFMFGKFGENTRIDGCRTVDCDKSYTLTTSKTHTNQYYLNSDRTKMRNLHINEYEQLQTLPIDYTKGITEGLRYKCVGNGWTIDVIQHIFSFLPNEYKQGELNE